MNLKDIKAMFVVGEKWNATRTGRALVANGNAGQSVLPANNVQNEAREVAKVGSVDLVWKREGSERLLYTKWPKASEIVEARPGYLKFAYDNFVTVELVRVS